MKLFDEIKPVFFIDNKMNNILNDINVKLKKINVNDKQKRKYMISKSKIRSIHSSLAIEANSLSLFDVESISENKLILGKKDEVQEVKNAIEAYNHINEYNYKSENDLLKLHELMMKYCFGKLKVDNREGVNRQSLIFNRQLFILFIQLFY